MKKSVGILSGLAVAIAVATTAGAWYTGQQLPAELEQAVVRGNQQLEAALVGSGGSMTVELVSLDRHFFSSDARYRIKARDLRVDQGEPVSFEIGVADHIEHGPLPWSRVTSLKLLPVMAVSNATIEQDATTADWFAATGGKSPVTAQVSLGYGDGVDSDIDLAAAKVDEGDGNVIDFSGMQLRLEGDREGKSTHIKGEAGHLAIAVVGQDHPPMKFDFKDFRVAGQLKSTGHDMVYVGHLNMILGELQATLGPTQDVLLLKSIEQNNRYTDEGDNKLGGQLEYKVGDITYAGRKVGSGSLVFSMKSLNIPAMQALLAWYQSRLPELQEAAARGEALPSLDMAPEETAKVQGELGKLLADKPRLSLDELSFKTANGESRLNLAVDFAKPLSFDLPPDQFGKQLVSKLEGKLSLSKPMVGDLATLQALLDGQTDARAIALQSGQAGEMLGMMALQSGLATVDGDNVVTTLHYADGMVDFNGRTMTVEEFAMLLAQLGALAPQG